MTRLVVSDPGAAHSAKNTTAPGLPNQPANDSKGRTLMVSQGLIARASQRLGHRPELVGVVVDVIARRSATGYSDEEVSAYLKDMIGPDNPAATVGFVAWVLDEVERGEGR